MYYLTNYETNFQPRFKKEFISVSVEFILKNNTLTFEAEHFLQIQGKAMSTITIIYLFIVEQWKLQMNPKYIKLQT